MVKEQELTDLNKIPTHMKSDYMQRNENIESGKKLCKRCNGTGNELFSMYKKCTACNGRGQSW